jgi:hypothetical protein
MWTDLRVSGIRLLLQTESGRATEYYFIQHFQRTR